MVLLTEQEIYELADDGVFLGNVKEITRAIEAKVIEKIKAQGPVAWAATSEDGVVEALGFNQSKNRFVVPLYRLPEGD